MDGSVRLSAIGSTSCRGKRGKKMTEVAGRRRQTTRQWLTERREDDGVAATKQAGVGRTVKVLWHRAAFFFNRGVEARPSGWIYRSLLRLARDEEQ